VGTHFPYSLSLLGLCIQCFSRIWTGVPMCWHSWMVNPENSPSSSSFLDLFNLCGKVRRVCTSTRSNPGNGHTKEKKKEILFTWICVKQQWYLNTIERFLLCCQNVSCTFSSRSTKQEVPLKPIQYRRATLACLGLCSKWNCNKSWRFGLLTAEIQSSNKSESLLITKGYLFPYGID
jgi:hypothetical protein